MVSEEKSNKRQGEEAGRDQSVGALWEMAFTLSEMEGMGEERFPSVKVEVGGRTSDPGKR